MTPPPVQSGSRWSFATTLAALTILDLASPAVHAAEGGTTANPARSAAVTPRLAGARPSDPKPSSPHVLAPRERVLHPDDGLLLGNGDLSVSVYQTADRIVWRFGKGEVWDRRLDLSDDPKPAHIAEIAHGIAVEGWKCPPYGGPVEATRGTTNAARMKELCQGAPPTWYFGQFPWSVMQRLRGGDSKYANDFQIIRC